MCQMHFINVKHKSGLHAVIIKFIRPGCESVDQKAQNESILPNTKFQTL